MVETVTLSRQVIDDAVHKAMLEMDLENGRSRLQVLFDNFHRLQKDRRDFMMSKEFRNYVDAYINYIQEYH